MYADGTVDIDLLDICIPVRVLDSGCYGASVQLVNYIGAGLTHVRQNKLSGFYLRVAGYPDLWAICESLEHLKAVKVNLQKELLKFQIVVKLSPYPLVFSGTIRRVDINVFTQYVAFLQLLRLFIHFLFSSLQMSRKF